MRKKKRLLRPAILRPAWMINSIHRLCGASQSQKLFFYFGRVSSTPNWTSDLSLTLRWRWPLPSGEGPLRWTESWAGRFPHRCEAGNVFFGGTTFSLVLATLSLDGEDYWCFLKKFILGNELIVSSEGLTFFFSAER